MKGSSGVEMAMQSDAGIDVLTPERVRFAMSLFATFAVCLWEMEGGTPLLPQ